MVLSELQCRVAARLTMMSAAPQQKKGASGNFGKAARSAGAAHSLPFAPFASSTVGFSSGRRVPRAASAWSAMRTLRHSDGSSSARDTEGQCLTWNF